MTTQPSDWAVELLPCPFCGRPARRHTSRTKPAFYVACWPYGCGMLGPEKDTLTEAVTAWNTRAPVARELDASGGDEPLGYTAIFNAIAAATWPAQEGVAINVSVAKFHESIGGNVYATPRAAEAGDVAWITKMQDFIGPAALAYLRSEHDSAMAALD